MVCAGGFAQSNKDALVYPEAHAQQTEIDEYLRAREADAEKLRDQFEAKNSVHLDSLKARLDAVRAQRNGGHAPTPD